LIFLWMRATCEAR